MIGRLPGTLEDRAVHVLMKRAMRGEVKRSFRPDRADDLDRLRSQAARFAADHMAALAAAEPELPPGAFNRFADNWRPLAAVADLAGGRWPALARAAILADLGQADDDELGQQLLEDVRAIFDDYVDDDGRTKPAQKLPSKIICGALHEMDDRPWKELGRNETPITQNKLARMLKPFGIAPHGPIRLPSGKTPQGYLRSAFEEAWNCYLLPGGANQTATVPQAKETAIHSDFQGATPAAGVAVEKRQKPRQSAGCGTVAVEEQGSGEGGKKSNGEGRPTPTVASVPFMITRAMKAGRASAATPPSRSSS